MSAHLLGYFNLSDITLRAFLNFFHILSLLVLVTEPVRPCHKGNEATFAPEHRGSPHVLGCHVVLGVSISWGLNPIRR